MGLQKLSAIPANNPSDDEVESELDQEFKKAATTYTERIFPKSQLILLPLSCRYI